jgi:hypothetical protein
MDFVTNSPDGRFLAVWNHGNPRYFVTGHLFWIDEWAACGWRVYR